MLSALHSRRFYTESQTMGEQGQIQQLTATARVTAAAEDKAKQKVGVNNKDI